MSNHPNRAQIRFPARLLDIGGSPDPTEVLGRRINANITQQEAADMLYTSKRAYQQWEYGDRAMLPAVWALFLIRTEKACNRG